MISSSQVTIPPDFIDFGIGQPAMDILPTEVLRQATAHRLAQEDNSLLNYGANNGDGYFLHALATFLTRHYGEQVDPNGLFVTGGTSQALDYVCQRFTQPGDVILVEEPTYFLASSIFTDHGLKVVGVPMESNGIDLFVLETAIRQHRPRLLYTIPTFHNPTGMTMSWEKRQAVVALSKRYGFLVVADEVYQLLDYTETPPPPMAHFVNSGQVLSLGTFSKILAPGLRLGWIQTAPTLLEKLSNGGMVVSGGSLNHFTSTVVRSALELGLQDEYLGWLKGVLGRRLALMDERLRVALGETPICWEKPHGGYFFWLQLPDGVNTTVLRQLANREQVGFQAGVRFSSKNGLQNYLRLSFAFYNEMDIESGVSRLAALLR